MKIQNTTFESNFVIFPQDCNYMPPMVFGGKMLSEMDVCAAMTVRRAMYGTECDSAVTVGVSDVCFLVGAVIGDLIFVKGTIIKVGIKSIRVFVECWREDKHGAREKVATGHFTFVSRHQEKPAPHGLELQDT